ncbi:MAG: sensor histidine kinase [Syntrophobacteraceae bacterium]
MLERLKTKLAPPIFADDEERTRIARLLNSMLFAALVMGLVFVPIGALTKGSYSGVLIIMGILIALTPVMLLLLRRGYVKSIGLLVVSLFFIGAVCCVFVVGSIRSPIASLFMLCTVGGGLYFGNRGAVAVAALSLVALSGLWWAETNGLFPPYKATGFVPLETHSALLIGTAVFLAVFTRNLNETLERARSGERTLAERNLQLEVEITERMRMEDELRKSRDELELRVQERTLELELANEKLCMVPSRLIEAQENERQRIAGDLHDSIGQTLAALKFRIEHVITTLEKQKSKEALRLLNEFVPILQLSIDETRAIYMGLKPMILSEHGILSTLAWYRQELLKLHPNQHIELETTIKEEDIPDNLKTTIFRIAQEALNNTFKHGKPEWVDVRLAGKDGAIELEISDDGIGMDLDHILESLTAKSLGIIGMKERTELTGGEFTIKSAPNEGTSVRAVWRNH